ncbi:MAG: ComEC/Rec2 family competence protein [Elusimicrobiaceae bacterium]|nr:ComEC/Rec2 family competence protein [Elusimicrobiaceae bacterium]
MHPDIYKRPLLLVLILLIAGLFLFYKPAPSKRDVAHHIQQEITLTGRVEGFYRAKPTSNNVTLKVFSVNGEKATGYVYARLKNFEPAWKDTLEVPGKLQEPYGIDLLGNFNWRTYLASKHVFAEIKSEDVRIVKPAAWPWRVLRALREDILRVFAENFSPDLANIAGGILLGERGELDPELYSAFQDSGAIHLLVASGGNVGFVTLMTLAVCGLFNLRRKKALLLALAVAGIYTLVAGADAPLLRAYFMAVCACAGYYLGRNSGVFQGLLVSCFVILIWAPASLFETGFVMSFLATAALLICLNNYPVPAKWPRVVRFFAQIFLATLAVQLALLPVFTNVFYKVSLTGLAANMMLVPLASLLLGLSFAYYVFSVLHIGILLFYPTQFCLTIFQWLVEFFASFRLSALPVAAWSSGAIVSYYAFLFLALNVPVKNFVKKAALPLLTVALVAPVIGYATHRGTYVYLLDEWYKNAALVKTADGNLFVVAGKLPPEKIEPALHKLGRRQADAVFITQPGRAWEEVPWARQLIRPFEDVWPGENVGQFKHTAVRMEWGRHSTKDGRIWYNTGYSGSKKDDASYCFAIKEEPEICVAAGARFVQQDARVIEPTLNATVAEKL